MLVGRDAELARISRLVAQAADGRGGALVLRGEAGIGKTSLLGHARRAGANVISLSGSEAESNGRFSAYAGERRKLLPGTLARPRR